jgi:hypothetical protein
MIRDVQDVTDLFDRRFGSAMLTPLSLVRTLAWLVLGMYLVGLVIPAPHPPIQRARQLHGLPMRDLMLDKNDPRGWREVKKDPHKFTIAWIGGSTIQTVEPGHGSFLPLDVRDRVPTIDGRPVEVNMYLMEASRIFDLNVVTAEALATKPDLVVLDLNPLWLFNPNAVQEWDNLNPAATPRLIPDPDNWPLMASLYSPSDLALSAASSHLGSIRDRWTYSRKLSTVVDKFSAVTEAPLPTGRAPKLSGARLIAAMNSPLSFWNRFRPNADPDPAFAGYPAYLRQAKTDGSALNDTIIKRMLKTMSDSKIPALAYLSAVDPATLTHPATDAALHRVESHLQEIAAPYDAGTLQVQWQSGIRLVHGLEFRDMAHMTYDAPFADLMAATVCAHLTALDPQTACKPTSRTAP